MKRYAGRRTKPKLSQWCAKRAFPWWSWDPKRDRMRRSAMSGHVVCQGERWHRPEHLNCCGTADERESYACQCSCHA